MLKASREVWGYLLCSRDMEPQCDDPTDNSLLLRVQMGATMCSVAETVAALETALYANKAIIIVAHVDHQANR